VPFIFFCPLYSGLMSKSSAVLWVPPRLDPAQPAEQAARQIHLGLLQVIEANLEGARAGQDPECLHDLRVATRRTRSALGQIREVFPAAEVARFKAEFAWLQQVTSTTRDLDVYLLALDGYRAALPPELRMDIQPFEGFLVRHRAVAQAVMARELSSARLRQLLTNWRAFLEAPGPAAGAGTNAARPLRAVADARLHRLHRRVLEQGQAITDRVPAEALHELRKSCKKLRYLLEAFQSLYAPKQVQRMLKRLKALLNELGSCQDLTVQVRALRDMGGQMLAEGEGGPATLMALGALVADLGNRQRAARARFSQVFEAFDSGRERRLFKELLRSS
jgi:CHAD domain-containing protein